MPIRIVFTEDATNDIEDIFDYISDHDQQEKAEYVVDKILQAIDKLGESPDRGSIVKELRELGLKEYREVYFKPYRIIYRRIDKMALIYLIIDGRRDMQTVLKRRLFRIVE